MPNTPIISYGITKTAWDNYASFLESIASRPGIKKICEIGGGANPALSLDFITKHNIEYTILDISEKELAKAPAGYIKLVGDITKKDLTMLGKDYDLVFSKMFAEHVVDGAAFHRNVFDLLAPGGVAFHFFPTLYSLPFILNKLMPESLSEKILTFFDKARSKQGQYGKFPAYYSLCFGPTLQQIKKLQNMGYKIEKFIGFFGHHYFQKIPLLNKMSHVIAKLLLRFPVPALTSYAYVLLSKPE
ncbi:MAG: class I SAM-dependent methyltransferase [Gammaproteobacteria bacterium]